LAERNTDVTPFHYALNNPIRYIDPSGLVEIEVQIGNQTFSVGNGQNAKFTFEGSKLKYAEFYNANMIDDAEGRMDFMMKIIMNAMQGNGGGGKNTITNLMVIIVEDGNKLYKSHGATIGSFGIIVARDVSAAYRETINLFGKRTYSNVVIASHSGSYTFSKTITGYVLGPDTDKNKLVHNGIVESTQMAYYLNEETRGWNDAKTNKYIKDLTNIMNLTESNGNCVFMACNAGHDENLMKITKILTNNPMNLYFNLDPSVLESKEGVPLLNDEGKYKTLTDHKDYYSGWKKLDSQGNITTLNQISGKKGILYVNSAINGLKAITIK
jgi:hypothetical protein